MLKLGKVSEETKGFKGPPPEEILGVIFTQI